MVDTSCPMSHINWVSEGRCDASWFGSWVHGPEHHLSQSGFAVSSHAIISGIFESLAPQFLFKIKIMFNSLLWEKRWQVVTPKMWKPWEGSGQTADRGIRKRNAIIVFKIWFRKLTKNPDYWTLPQIYWICWNL